MLITKNSALLNPKGITMDQQSILDGLLEEAGEETGLEFGQIIYLSEDDGLTIGIFLRGKTANKKEMGDYYSRKLEPYLIVNTNLFRHYFPISTRLNISESPEKIQLGNLTL